VIDAIYRTFVPLGMLRIFPFLERRRAQWLGSGLRRARD
jgi:hypothetical protein